jgi:hypothetical protein
MNPDTGDASGTWLSWTPISALMGLKLLMLEAWK